MRDIWLISDTHFGHANIIRHCNRPFESVEEMNEVMIARWNAVVRPQDHIYHLGDVAGPHVYDQIMPRLAGHKRLILGNHDDTIPMQKLMRHFDKILAWRLFKPLLLTHVPIHVGSFGKADVNVHGHIHEKPSPAPQDDKRWFNACVEWQDYTPVHLETVCQRLGVILGQQ